MSHVLFAILIPLALSPQSGGQSGGRPEAEDQVQAQAEVALERAAQAQVEAARTADLSAAAALTKAQEELRRLAERAAQEPDRYARAQELAELQRTLAEALARDARGSIEASKERSSDLAALLLARAAQGQAGADGRSRHLEERIQALERRLGLGGGERHGSLEERVGELERTLSKRGARGEARFEQGMPGGRMPEAGAPDRKERRERAEMEGERSEALERLRMLDYLGEGRVAPREGWRGQAEEPPEAPQPPEGSRPPRPGVEALAPLPLRVRTSRGASVPPGRMGPGRVGPQGESPPLPPTPQAPGHSGESESPSPVAREPFDGPIPTPQANGGRSAMNPDRRREIEDMMRRMREQMDHLREEMNRLREEMGSARGGSAR